MINVNRYIINFSKFVTQRIPEELRFNDVIALLTWLVSPLVSVYNQLNTFRAFILYKLTITPQVVYMEKMLNDRYDYTLRRIYIEDGLTYEPLYIYVEAELEPKFLFTQGEIGQPISFLFTEGEVSQITNDFVVYVPNDVSFDEVEMKTRIKEYKLASKIFKIETF